MDGKMKAVMFRGPDDLCVDRVDVPHIGPDDVLMRSKVSGICHSDFDLLSGRYIVPFSYPVIPGHEWSGEVVEVGKNVDTFRVGDRVTGECVTGCEKCTVCKSGNFTYCPTSNHFGFTENGACAEYVKQRGRKLHKLPEGVSWEEGALVEPFTIAYYALYVQGAPDAGETAIVFGAGTIGCCAVAVARGMGATVIAVDPLPQRRELAKKIGADHALDPKDPAFLDQVMDFTCGGADFAMEASGNAAALQMIMRTVRNNGRVTFTGINIGQAFPIELGLIQSKGLNIKGTVGSPYCWERALKFIGRAKPNLAPIITHRFSLDQAQDAYRVAEDRKESVKVLFEIA
jgi:L-iditol 2-dehydrogenase